MALPFREDFSTQQSQNKEENVVSSKTKITTTAAYLSIAEDAAITPIGIIAPADTRYSPSQLKIVVTGLPSDGLVFLSDGVTKVYNHEILTVSQLTGLTFLATRGLSGKVSTLSYTVTDPSGAKATGRATLAIAPVTTPPTTVAASLTVAENSGATAIGIRAPSDPSHYGSPLSITVSGLPNDGTVFLADGTAVTNGQHLTVAQLTGLTFKPKPGLFGQSSTFSYTVTDTSGLSSTGSATLAIAPDTAPPVTIDPTLTVAPNSGPTLIGIPSPSDPNYAASQLIIHVTGLPSDGTVLLADGVTAVSAGQMLTVTQLIGLMFKPTPGVFSQSSAFTYSVTNPSGLSASGSEILAVGAPPLAPTVSWSSGSPGGTEGAVIAIGSLSAAVPAGDTLQSLVISAIPVGAVLSDGTHSFTATAGSTSVNVAGWTLSGLKITPTNDSNFTLTATATAKDGAGNTSNASASETVIVNPLAPSVAWSTGSATGTVASAIALGTLSDTVNGLSGDSNSLQSLVVAGIPAGSTLADGTHSFTAMAGSTSVNVAGWNLSHLTVMAASAMTFTLTATATEQNAAGAISSASSSEAVTVAGASSSGTPQLPNLFSGYAVRPPWQVAGVDYAVGLPAGTTLRDPSAPGALPAGVWISGNTINVTGNNVTLSGFDFSLHGGYGISVQGSGTTITDNNFLGTSQSGFLVHTAAGASNTTISYNTMNGGGATGDLADGELIYAAGQGLTVENNWIYNAPQHFVSVLNGGALTYSYNLLENGGWATGAHLNYLQWGGGNSTSPDIEYNTMVQDVTLAGGEGFQLYDNGSGTISNATLAHNTMITQQGSSLAETYIIHAGSPSSSSAFTGTINNNYFDTSGAYGAFYGGLQGFTYSGNINLVTGAQLN
jgi:hypothetical protein